MKKVGEVKQSRYSTLSAISMHHKIIDPQLVKSIKYLPDECGLYHSAIAITFFSACI